jgi:hypothetical protein
MFKIRYKEWKELRNAIDFELSQLYKLQKFQSKRNDEIHQIAFEAKNHAHELEEKQKDLIAEILILKGEKENEH